MTIIFVIIGVTVCITAIVIGVKTMGDKIAKAAEVEAKEKSELEKLKNNAAGSKTSSKRAKKS